VLGSVVGDKVQFVAAVSKDLQARKLHAGQLVKRVAAVAGGGGGGRPDLAQAGGKNPAKAREAVECAAQFVKEIAGESEG
jgi:alanyl-tRNA synthetase